VRHPLAWILGVAFLLRAGFGLARLGEPLDAAGYSLYVDIAESFLQGEGFCTAAGERCALRVPLYPLLLAPLLLTPWPHAGIVIAQAAAGTALVWLTWNIALALFDTRVALAAAGLVAVHPYLVIHDTALQETVIVNALLAGAVWMLIRARGSGGIRDGLGAGLGLALSVLTTARVALVVPFALIWMAMGSRSWWAGTRNAALVALPVVMLVGGWTLRNGHRVGAPVLTTEAGESLWVANNAATFSYYPVRSIDLSVVEAYRRLSREDLATLADLDAVTRDRLLGSWAVAHMTTNPMSTLGYALRKIWVVASAQYTPARSSAIQTGYLLLFVPIHVLAAVGLWRSRRAWRVHGAIWAVVAAFLATTALFWAHTSHKSHLDPLLFIYAIYAVSTVSAVQRPPSHSI
jgi:hypothetical protein